MESADDLVMSGGGTATDPQRDANVLPPTAERWEADSARRRRMAEVLDLLPVGFVVFHDLELPKPSRVIVDHVVIGPRSIWAVTTATYSEPIEVGQGRGSDTLWAGRTPLRSVLEACEANASAVADMIGRPVEPLLCVDAPSTPDTTFDFHGLAICIPHALAEHVGVTTTGFQDVAAVAATIERAFATAPADRTTLPTLGAGMPMPGSTRRVRPWPRRRGVVDLLQRHLRPRRLILIVGIVALLTFLPNVVGLGTSAAQRGVGKGVESVTDVLTPSTLVSEATGNDHTIASAGAPPDVWYVVTCPESGAGWLVSWVWPGPLPESAAAYGIATRGHDGIRIDRTISGWSDPSGTPAPIRLATSDDVTVITEYRDGTGATIASTDEPFRRPPGDC